jgi:hypothetical protein
MNGQFFLGVIVGACLLGLVVDALRYKPRGRSR